jgi:hypothetical protein
LKHLIWTRSYVSTIFASSQTYSKVKKVSWKKNGAGWNHAGLGGTALGRPIRSRSAREQRLTPGERGPSVSWRGRSNRYAERRTVGSRGDRRPSAIFLLWPRADMPETLAGAAGTGPHLETSSGIGEGTG